MAIKIEGKESISSRERLLKLKEIFETKTDEEHGLSLHDLVDELKKSFGPDETLIQIGEKAVRRDIQALREQGFEVIETIEEKGKKLYKFVDRLFERHELRMLIDVVSSAKSISYRDSNQLIEKLKHLTSEHFAKKLDSSLKLNLANHSENKEVRFAIDRIQTAIDQSQVLRYHYGHYNVDKEFVPRRNGEWYTVKPLDLIWKQDYYYLIAEYIPEGKVKHYRVDRMRDVEVMEEETFVRPLFDVSAYVTKAFNMYAGTEQEITIQFHVSLANLIIDHFGKNVPIKKLNQDLFEVNTKAMISDGLIQWILACGDKATVIAPASLVERMREETEKMFAKYR